MTDGARAVAVAVDLTVDNDARARRRRSNGVASASGRRESAVVLLSDGEDDARAPPAPTTGRATTTATKKRRRSVGDVVVVRETRDAGPIVLTGTPRGTAAARGSRRHEDARGRNGARRFWRTEASTRTRGWWMRAGGRARGRGEVRGVSGGVRESDGDAMRAPVLSKMPAGGDQTLVQVSDVS